MDLRERFESKYVPEPNTGCWLWTAATNLQGYGNFSFQGEVVRAHKIAWMLYRGELPGGKWILHHCDNPPCVNPAHLFIGTRQDNIADMIKKGRGNNQKLTHCHKGHSFTADNLAATKKGWRRCRKCMNERAAIYRAKNRGGA